MRPLSPWERDRVRALGSDNVKACQEQICFAPALTRHTGESRYSGFGLRSFALWMPAFAGMTVLGNYSAIPA